MAFRAEIAVGFELICGSVETSSLPVKPAVAQDDAAVIMLKLYFPHQGHFLLGYNWQWEVSEKPNIHKLAFLTGLNLWRVEPIKRTEAPLL